MKLTNLKEKLSHLVDKKKQGKKLKAKKIKKVLEKLEIKQKRLLKEETQANSDKLRKKVNLQLKVAHAQIKKAHRLLKDLDS